MPLRDLFPRFRRTPPRDFVGGNRVALLVDGRAFFGTVLEVIGAAERNVLVETYILASDRTGWRVAEALAAKAKTGVEVAVIYDGYGSLTLDRALVDHLRRAGVRTLEFNPVSLWKRVWPWAKRNHRKSVIVDSRVGIVGGQNLADDYAATEDGGHNWRDTAVRVEGPAVAQLEAMFRRTWALYGGEPLTVTSVQPPSFPDGHDVRFLGNFARRDRSFIRRAYMVAIVEARRSIRICNAYFVPDRVMMRALIRAARRGVKVEIIVGAATDVRAVLHMTRALYARLLRSGVYVYEWHDRVLHAKTAVIDGVWATIGSSNLDNLSHFRNLEVNAGITGEQFGRVMEDQFELDRARSTPVLAERWSARSAIQRFYEWLSVLARGVFYGP